MWAALRHRGGQVIALALVSALVVTCAVFAPVFARSVDQGLLREQITTAGPEQSATAIAWQRTQSHQDVLPEDITEHVPADLAAVSEEPISVMRAGTTVVTKKGTMPSAVALRSRTDVCGHLEVDGRCPTDAGEVLVSAADEKAWGWTAGTTLEVPQGRFAPDEADPPPVELTVVGIYAESADEPDYWLGDEPDGKSGHVGPDLDTGPGVDDLITTEDTFVDTLPHAAAMVLLPLDRDAASLESMPRAADAATRLAEDQPDLTVDESAEDLVSGIRAGQDQTAVIVPFVMVQLALLAVLVLFLVARAAVDQRRHEIALARLRGHSRRGARRLLLTELTIPVLLGLPLGFLAALGLAVGVRMAMLPAGIPFDLPLAILPWLLGAVLVSVLAVYLAARPVLREPVNDLLRSVAPERAGVSVVVDTVVVVLAALGAAGLASGALSGPAALATPTLLAIAVGVLAARLVPRLAAARARRAMSRGRVVAALAGHGIARRPAARRVLVVTTVATAVAVFGANAVVVADDNRLARAELETGAPATLAVDASSATQLVAAGEALADEDIDAAPVARISPRDSDAAETIAADPEALRRVAHPSAVSGLDLGALALPEQQPVRIPGEIATADVVWDLDTDGDTDPPVLTVDMTSGSGNERSIDIATLGPRSSGRTAVEEDLHCSNRCRLSGLSLETSGGSGSEVSGTVTIRGLEVDGDALPITDEGTWASEDDAVDVTTKGDALTLEVTATDGADATTHVTDIPRPLPAIASSEGTEEGEDLQVVDVAGGQADVGVRQTVEALPAATDRGVMVSLPALARIDPQVDTSRTRTQLWLADGSPRAVERATQVLSDEGVPVGPVTTTEEADRAYDRSASGWGLQLALVGGVLSVLLAGLVLVILAVTGWRAVVRDLAALRISGVSHRVVDRSLRAEHLVSVAIGVLLGAACALVGAWVALPSIPLFTDPAPVPPPDLGPAWSAVLVSTAVVAAVLMLVALVLAGAVVRQVRLAAARGEAT